MLGLVPNDSWMKENDIIKGILLPEGLNLIYYDTIDDIFFLIIDRFYSGSCFG